jgi:hypothetical protein
MDGNQMLYLSSLESYLFEPVRACLFVRLLRFDTGKPCALVRLSPAVPGASLGTTGDLDTFVLATRHEGATIEPIDEFPCFVHIGRPLIVLDDGIDVITAAQVEVLAWGELYRTADDAANHSFG